MFEEWLKWPLLATLLVYIALVVVRTSRIAYYPQTQASVSSCCEDRQTDISDSRLSNFGSNNELPLDTSELPVNRIFPLTDTLNRVMDRVCRKVNLYVQLENKKILPIAGSYLNLTFFQTQSKEEVKNNAFGMDPVVSRIDTLYRLGNAYIEENSNKIIVIILKLRFRIMKYKYDFYDKDLILLGSSSFIYTNNTFQLNITLSTSFDNSNCKISCVDFTFVPDSKSCTLKVDGLVGTQDFYSKLKSVLFYDFSTKVTDVLKQVIVPYFTKILNQANICSYFNARDSKPVEFTEELISDNLHII